MDITFEGNGKQKLIANFENCTLDGVRFTGCDLSACIPPTSKNHLYVEKVSARENKKKAYVCTHKLLLILFYSDEPYIG
ncbi:hypothetical protein C5695_09235 [Bacillus pumilus]|uniref:Uncharacterized protein n=1 Tax=Bacillus pumilus TaxID=1408 RepID=A0AAD0HMM9_BACPU|nr:hypothetical protein C5695_09235 [Bacillus pumilus]